MGIQVYQRDNLSVTQNCDEKQRYYEPAVSKGLPCKLCQTNSDSVVWSVCDDYRSAISLGLVPSDCFPGPYVSALILHFIYSLS